MNPIAIKFVGASILLFNLAFMPTAARSFDSNTSYLDLLQKVQLFPHLHCEAEFLRYFNRKNDFFIMQYFAEFNNNVDFSIISYNNTVSLIGRTEIRVGLGQTPGDIIFDPLELDFGIVPALEYNLKKILILHIGADHRCFHEIDQKTRKTPYWNEFIFSVGSVNSQFFSYLKGLAHQSDKISNVENFAWRLKWGYFIKDFFGIVPPSKINGNNERVQEFDLELRYLLFKRYGFFSTIFSSTKIGNDTKYSPYYSQRISIENGITAGGYKTIVFISYNSDNMDIVLGEAGKKIWSRDKLVSLGIRILT